jgi:hypothetical protein
MICRILVNELVWEMSDAGYVRADRRQLRGPSGELSDVMWKLRLPASKQGHSHRARYYFTEFGRCTIGKAPAARGRGFLVQVICRKNPPSSDVAFHDKFQVALLPRGGKR